ncbi:MAG: AAA family ATPase [Oscillospiraceae bacterium]|nr:AAA family ATPase [Clostridia bacterium]MBO5639119.1 AAA family ATPase [Oscillospiraceae bacterium]
MLYWKIQPYIESCLKSDSNKALIIDGARQIGKTFIIRHVGKQLFENYNELNFAEDQNVPRCSSLSARSRIFISRSAPSPAKKWARRKTH